MAGMSDEVKELTCNREAFANDSSCSRGDVDIHAFDDLPICCVKDPTPADGGPQPDDYPVIPFTPPPCSCIAVNAGGGGGITQDKEPHVAFSFTAIGDCCEGNYDANVSVEVPCIAFDIDSSTQGTVDIEESCLVEEPSGTIWLEGIAEECALTFIPHLELKLPKPPSYNVELDLSTPCACPGSYSWTEEYSYQSSSLPSSGSGGEFECSAAATITSSSESSACGITKRIHITIPRPLVGIYNTQFQVVQDECDIIPYVEVEKKVKKTCTQYNEQKKFKLHLPKEKTYDFKTELELSTPCACPGSYSWTEEYSYQSSSLPSSDGGGEFMCSADATMSVESYDSTVGCEVKKGQRIKLTIPRPLVGIYNTQFQVVQDECDIIPYVEVEKKVKKTCTQYNEQKKFKLHLPRQKKYVGCSSGSVTLNSSYSGLSGTATIDIPDECSAQVCPVIDLNIPPQNVTMEGVIVDSEEPFIYIEKQGTITHPHFVIYLGLHGGTHVSPGSDSSSSSRSSWTSHDESITSGSESKSESISASQSASESQGESESRSASQSASESQGGSESRGGSESQGGSESRGGGSSTSEFQFVENVACNESGGLTVTKKRCVIDFENQTVEIKELNEEGGDTQAEARLARDLLVSTVKAISNDPSILDIVDKPESEAAKKALRKIGIYSGLTEEERNEELLI